MSGKRGVGKNEARNNSEIWMGEISLTGNIGRIEQFRGYLKIYPREGGWILRIPPSKLLIRPYDKAQAKEIARIYKEIEKQKLGKILNENWRILEKYGYGKKETIISKEEKVSMNLQRLTKRELIELLKKQLEEDE